MTDMPTPPGGLNIPQPLRCPRCDHLTVDHQAHAGTGYGPKAGCHVALAGDPCLCGYTPDEIVAATVLDRISTVVETGEAPPLPRTSMVTAVQADLHGIPVKPGGVNGSMRALAMYLAEAVDQHAADPKGANPSTTARLAQELRTVLADIARRDDSVDDEIAEFTQNLGTPERGDS